MAGEIEIIAKAKADLEAAGQKWETSCDAYRITNLAAQRTPGWKVQEKTSGDNCQNRKVDGIIANGNLYDCMILAGPPANANTPSWQFVGPQNELVAKDPYPWPDPAEQPGPGPGPEPEPTPEPGPAYDEIIQKLDTQTQLLLAIDAKMNALAVQSNANTEKIQTQIHDLVEDMEESLQKYVPLVICRYQAGGAAPTGGGGLGELLAGLFSRSKSRKQEPPTEPQE